MNACCLQVDRTLLAQACRLVLALRYHKSSVLDENPDTCYRTFWVIYHMEKQDSFQARSSSVRYHFASMFCNVKLTDFWELQTIADYDIGCRIPAVPESMFGEYNWFVSAIRFSRVLSVAYETLFSVNAFMGPTASQLQAIDYVHELLEAWRVSIPLDFRPLEKHTVRLSERRTRLVAVQTQYYYYHLIIALERLTLYLDQANGARRSASKKNILLASRTVIELTRFVDIEPYTPILWVSR